MGGITPPYVTCANSLSHFFDLRFLLEWVGAGCTCCDAGESRPSGKLVESRCFSGGGRSKEKLSAAREYANSIHSSAVMIIEHGEVIDEWGDTDQKISSYSVRKSLISALYGIYSAEGVINVNQTLEQAGIGDSPDPLTKDERQARIVDLLRARSGIYHPVDFETDYMKKTRPERDSHVPGTLWYYNNWDFNALGTIFEKKTGLKIGDAFYERIAKPIGMQDFQPSDVYYMGGPVSIHRAYHFEITARDMARFGLLYLRHGRWGNKQIVPEAWVEKSSHASEMIKFHDIEMGATSICRGWNTEVLTFRGHAAWNVLCTRRWRTLSANCSQPRPGHRSPSGQPAGQQRHKERYRRSATARRGCYALRSSGETDPRRAKTHLNSDRTSRPLLYL